MKATTKHVLNDTTVSVKSTKQKYKLMEDIEGQEQRNINQWILGKKWKINTITEIT